MLRLRTRERDKGKENMGGEKKEKRRRNPS